MFNELRSNGWQPDVVTQSYSLLKSGCWVPKIGESFTLVPARVKILWTLVYDIQLRFAHLCKGTLILAHVRAGELDGAEEVLQRMAVQHVLPNVALLAELFHCVTSESTPAPKPTPTFSGTFCLYELAGRP